MAAKGSKNIVEDACTISTSYSKNQHLYVETEDKDRIIDLKGNKENPQGRRPALGRKRARFTLKSISCDSSENSGIYDIVEPQEYFTAVDQMQKAEEELKKCQSGAAADLTPHHPSPTVRNRRRGILGRAASYKHHLSDNAEATIALKMLQEDIPGQGIPSPATVSANTELHLETTEKGISPSMEPKNRTLQETSNSKKNSTSNRPSNSRNSIADAGLTWKSGVRRSTRIKTRPLQHWCGEKLLYGRVHNNDGSLQFEVILVCLVTHLVFKGPVCIVLEIPDPAAKGSKNIVEDACTISTSYSKNQHLYVETEDKDRIIDLRGNKENPQGRRPALGRKRAWFTLKSISWRAASYKHHLSDNADATIALKMLQEDIPGQGIPSPATVSANTELHLETTEKGISPSMEPKVEPFGDIPKQGIVTEKGSIDDVLEKLFSSVKDFNGDNGVKLLQEKLRAKSRNPGKITLPEPDGIQRSNPRILKSMTRKGLDGSQLSEQTPIITTRSPLAVIANLRRRISLKDPLSDPYAMPLSDDEPCLGEAMGQKIPLSSADMNHVVTNNIPADDAFTPEIVRGKRTSFVEKIHLSAHDANRTINKKKPSEEDNVEHSPDMCINSVDSCGFSNLENNVAAGHDGPSAKELDTALKEGTSSEFVTQNDMEVLASPPSTSSSSNISKRINASASSFSGDATLQDEVNVVLEGETISHAKDSEEISRSRSSRKIGQNINNSGNGGTSSSQRDTVLQEEVNVIVQGEAVSSAEVLSGSLVGDARNLSTNPEDDASPLREFLPENRPSTIVPEENNENRTLQDTSGVSPVGVRKRKAPLHGKSKKKSTSNRPSNSRNSIADAGLTWKSGVRRSTRIKTRPLQHWCGEKVLYGRVHNSMITVIGIRYAEREVDGKSPVLKVKSYVSDQYADLVSKVAK